MFMHSNDVDFVRTIGKWNLMDKDWTANDWKFEVILRIKNLFHRLHYCLFISISLFSYLRFTYLLVNKSLL